MTSQPPPIAFSLIEPIFNGAGCFMTRLGMEFAARMR
jgi:hypothetical protein